MKAEFFRVAKPANHYRPAIVRLRPDIGAEVMSSNVLVCPLGEVHKGDVVIVSTPSPAIACVNAIISARVLDEEVFFLEIIPYRKVAECWVPQNMFDFCPSTCLLARVSYRRLRVGIRPLVPCVFVL